MSLPVSSYFLFQPEAPSWLVSVCQNRYTEYLDEYQALGNRYGSAHDYFFDGENINVDQINDYNDEQKLGLGHLGKGLIMPYTDKNVSWYSTVWPHELPPPTDEDLKAYYWSSMCYGLQTWQMYKIMLCQQFVRLGQFGHFGRKKE